MSNVVVDTNAFIDGLDPCEYEKVFLVSTVAEELDSLKRNRNELLARSAKDAIKRISKAYDEGKVVFREKFTCSFPLDLAIPDNRILAFAKEICAFDDNAVLVSADHNVILKAKCLNIPCEYYQANEACQRIYDGYKEILLSDNEMASFYENKENKWDLNENEYLILRNSDGTLVDKLRWTKKGFVSIYKKNLDSIALGRFKPKDVYQECAVDSLVNTEFSILTGPAGSAKTLSALSYIMQELQSGNRISCKIIFSTAPLRNNRDVGFLPGSRNDKLLGGSLGGILSSKLGGMLQVEQLIAQGKLVLVPSADIRGMEVNENDILFITEAQNMDAYTMKTALQRVKDGTKVIVEGDIEEQVDMIHCEGRLNGMMRAIKKFAGTRVFSCVRLVNIYRGEIANIAQGM